MTLRIVGAGLPRTGTKSLKHALERLLGAPCYHMLEFFEHPGHAATWRDAYRGEMPDWDAFLAGYVATVDTPACDFWRDLAAAYPDAPVLLSRRESVDVWYASMERTVLAQARKTRAAIEAGGDPGTASGSGSARFAGASPGEQAAIGEMFQAMSMSGRATATLDEPDAVRAGYERRLAEVRAAIPADRLVEWQPGDGWEPLCTALGVPVPAEEFPHENTTAEFTARAEKLRGEPDAARSSD